VALDLPALALFELTLIALAVASLLGAAAAVLRGLDQIVRAYAELRRSVKQAREEQRVEGWGGLRQADLTMRSRSPDREADRGPATHKSTQNAAARDVVARDR
jgi:hypothetical protein